MIYTTNTYAVAVLGKFKGTEEILCQLDVFIIENVVSDAVAGKRAQQMFKAAHPELEQILIVATKVPKPNEDGNRHIKIHGNLP